MAVFTACENEEWEFPDFEYTTVYFPYQSPVRTLVLGTDYVNDNTLDNAHKSLIMATMGGVYENNTDRILNVEVDNSLCDNLWFSGDSTKSVKPMPAGYYSLPSDMQIVIPSGEIIGGIEVTFTDAFFADTLSIENNYVIPLVINSVTNADSILRGESEMEDPNRVNEGDWNELPKDYILYAVKYKNEYDGVYLRRGVAEITGNGDPSLDTTSVYHEEHVEDDLVVDGVRTISLNEVAISLTSRVKGSETDILFEIVLDFDDQGNCDVTKDPSETAYDVSGSGQYVNNGDSWGGEERDALYLDYTVDFGTSTHDFTDTLVLRDRAVAFETFGFQLME